MADLKYIVDVQTRQAQQNLKNLNNQVEDTNELFGKLKGAIAGLAIGSFITQSLSLANSMRDMANATGIALQGVVGFSQALAANGGTIDRARDGMSDLVKNMGEAANGSSELAKAFGQVGVSFQDLNNLGPEEILERVVAGLSGVENVSQRTAIALRLFGESFKGVDVAGLNRDLSSFIANAADTARAVDAAGKASQNFKNASNQLQVALLQALQPLSELAVTITENKALIREITDLIVNLGIAFTSLYAISKISKMLSAASIAMAKFTQVGAANIGVLAAVRNQVNLHRVAYGYLSASLGSVRAAFLGAAIAAKAFGAALLAALPVIGQIISIGLLFKSIYDYFTDSADEAADAIKKQTDELTKQGEQTNKTIETIDLLAEAYRKLNTELNKTAREYDDTFRNQREALELANEQIGKSQQEIALQSELAAAKDTYYKRVIDLQQQLTLAQELASITTRKLTDDEQALVNSKEKLAGAIQSALQSYNDQVAAIKKLVDANEQLTRAENMRQFVIKSNTDLQNKLNGVLEDTARLGLTEIEQKYYDIAIAARNSAKAAVEAEAARRGTALSKAEVEQYYRAAAAGQQRLIRATEEHYRASRSWSVGWKQAFNEYYNNATNAAQRARDIFQQAFQGIEDVLVNFVKTGRFEWKSFVADMLETLLRANIQSVLASLGTAFSGFGFLGDIFGALGGNTQERGGSASNPLYVLDVSTGRVTPAGSSLFGPSTGSTTSGPSLIGSMFNTVSNVGSSIGNTVKNVVGSVASTFGGIIDTVKSVAGSFGSGVANLFSGFFATGGTIPAGRYGVVGERGPELVTGPATVTPLGNTQVTYNINAVDAASFKALVARDPGFIHAVATMGGRGIPR